MVGIDDLAHTYESTSDIFSRSNLFARLVNPYVTPHYDEEINLDLPLALNFFLVRQK